MTIAIGAWLIMMSSAGFVTVGMNLHPGERIDRFSASWMLVAFVNLLFGLYLLRG